MVKFDLSPTLKRSRKRKDFRETGLQAFVMFPRSIASELSTHKDGCVCVCACVYVRVCAVSGSVEGFK